MPVLCSLFTLESKRMFHFIVDVVIVVMNVFYIKLLCSRVFVLLYAQ